MVLCFGHISVAVMSGFQPIICMIFFSISSTCFSLHFGGGIYSQVDGYIKYQCTILSTEPLSLCQLSTAILFVPYGVMRCSVK